MVQFYIDQAEKCKKLTYEHFSAEGKPKSTIYDVIRRFEYNNSVEYKSLSGRSKSIATPKLIRKIKREFKNQLVISVRSLANKLKISQFTLSHIKIKQLQIRARTKKTVPRYINKQEARAKSAARNFSDKTK